MSLTNISDRDYTFDIGRYFSRGWTIFKTKALMFSIFTLLLIILLLLSSLLPYPLGTGNLDEGEVGGNLISNIILALLLPGFYIFAFNIVRNRAATFGDFFKGLNRALQIFLLSTVRFLLIPIVYLLTLLPFVLVFAILITFGFSVTLSSLVVFLGAIAASLLSLYLTISYMFSLPLLLEKRLNIWAAMETSRKIITKKWFAFFGLFLLLGLLNIAGTLPLFIGLLVTLPLTYCILTAAYEDVVGLNAVADVP